MTLSLRDRIKERRRIEQGLPPLDPEPGVEVPGTPARQPQPMKPRQPKAPRVPIATPAEPAKAKAPVKRSVGSCSRPCRSEGCDQLAFGNRRYCDDHRNSYTARAWYAGRKEDKRRARTELRGDTMCSECGSYIKAEDRFNDQVVTCSAACKAERRKRLQLGWQSRNRSAK